MRARDVRVRESDPARGYFWALVILTGFVAAVFVVVGFVQ